MFRASSAHLQEDIVVHKQHMVPSLSIRVLVACRYAARVRTHSKYYKFWVCVCIQHAMHMRHIVICGLSGSTIFSHIISQKVWFLGEKIIECSMDVLIFSSTLSETFLFLRRTEKDMVINMYLFPCKVPIFLVRCYRNLNILDRYSKNTSILNFMKIRPVRA